MDFFLRCNSLKCRVPLNDAAVVTTCSHIFCEPCADALGLANTPSTGRRCPACGTNLPNLEDVAKTQLNPSEEYKTSVLSGLSPAIITECAGRALTFWSYQSSQEIIYQEYLAKSLTEKYGDLNDQLDKIINDANAQIESLNHRIQGVNEQKDLIRSELLKTKNDLKERDKKVQRLEDEVRKLKAYEQTGAAQAAAFDTAEMMLHGGHGGGFPRYGSPPLGHSQDNMRTVNTGMPPPPPPGSYFGPQQSRMQLDTMATPQHSRPRGGPTAPFSSMRSAAHHNSWRNQSQASQPQRTPLSEISGNAQPRTMGVPGPGLTAGMKQGASQYSHMAQYGSGLSNYG